jgi:hypothetical protein
MKITDAVERLLKLREKHGEDVEVYFDCPWCGKSFTPDKVVGAAVHLTSKTPELIRTLTAARDRLIVERDAAKDQFDRHVEWASRQTEPAPGLREALRVAREALETVAHHADDEAGFMVNVRKALEAIDAKK